VPELLHIWDPQVKEKKPTKTGKLRKPSKADEKKAEEEGGVQVGSGWEILDVVQDGHLVADQVEYHGNFNADIFESLFDQFCSAVCEHYPLSLGLPVDSS
jgi:hypothetical protein